MEIKNPFFLKRNKGKVLEKINNSSAQRTRKEARDIPFLF
jgi:hypothetical protein